MIYLSNDPYPQEISIPRSFGVIVPRRTEYLTRDDIATDLETDTDRKVLAASQGVRLKEMIDGKADANDVYTKTEVDDALADKADKDDTYTKQQTDALLSEKADKSSVYTKQQVDTALSQKANTADIPTKTSDLQNDSGFVTGQEVSQTYETKADATAKETALQTAINGKQDTIDADHKLDYSLLENTPTIPAAQVPADWDATTGVSRILNKPTIPAAQVNSDWNSTSGVAQILNKPSIPVNYAGSPTPGGFATKAVAIPFGSVDSDSTATNIKASVDNFPTTLVDGVCAYIRNDVVASAPGWTLNINGTGAKPVYASNADATRTTTIFTAAVTYLFIYNSTRVEGGCWDMYYGYNANDNTIGYNLRTNTMSLPVTSACYRYRLLFTSADGTHFVPANSSTSTNATAKRTTTSTPIDPFGSIRYYGSTTAVSSGARPGATYLWEQYSVTLGYSFNRTGAALTLTAWKPVYIKCAPQTDGSAIIDAEEPYVQELPTTADGEIYIYLGVATSATQVEVVFHHPVYYIDQNGRKRVWTGEDISI